MNARKPREKNLIHEIFPAEKRLAKIDELEIELDRRRGEMPLTEYVRAKRSLTIRRLQEFKRIERANNWNPLEVADPGDDLPAPVDDTPNPEPVTPRSRRYLHYAIFWVDLVLLTMLFCWVMPLLKK